MIRFIGGRLSVSKWLCLGVLLAPTPALAGAPSDSTGVVLSLARGRLFTMAGQEVLFSRLAMSRTTCGYLPIGPGENQDIPASGVARIERATRNDALRGGLGLGLALLAGVAFELAQAESQQPGLKLDPGTKAAWSLGAGSFGALVGTAIGMRRWHYVTAYENSQLPR